MFRLAWTQRILGDYERAYELDTAVVAGYRVLLGETHPDTLRAKLAIAADLGALGRFSESKEAAGTVAEEARLSLSPDDEFRQEIQQSAKALETVADRFENED